MSKGVASLIFSVLLCVLLIACGGSSGPGSATPTPAAARASQLQAIGSDPSEVGLSWVQTDAEGSLKIASCRAFRAGMGEAVHLTGEIENTGDSPVGSVKLIAVGKGLGDKVMDTREEKVLVDPIPPKGKSFFKIFYDMRDVQRTELSVQGQTTDAQPAQTLEVSAVEMTKPASGYTHVKGQVKNTLDNAVPNVRLVVVLRESGGTVVEATVADVSGPIEAGASKSFDALALYRGATSAEVRAEAR
ncbi:MAG: hypothetical protein FJZ90_02615 [Chloroflexi bacterium]|nr:hypothetical protein [Chloroflexota bacterium]